LILKKIKFPNQFLMLLQTFGQSKDTKYKSVHSQLGESRGLSRTPSIKRNASLQVYHEFEINLQLNSALRLLKHLQNTFRGATILSE
ncbi:11014_t:CDS:1, partial [Ambispora gerdemannii]